MVALTKEQTLAYLRERLREAGPAGVEIRETVPKWGGFRERHATMLVALGEAEWIVPGKLVRERVGG